jgi:hypothetical protein
MLRLMRGAIVVVVTASALAGCNRPRWDNPADAYRSFGRAVQKAEFSVAWGALSADSRSVLEQRAKDISADSGGAVGEDPRMLFFGSGVQPPVAREVALVSQDGEAAVLKVTPEDGPPREVRMVREAGGWKLDVSQWLKD